MLVSSAVTISISPVAVPGSARSVIEPANLDETALERDNPVGAEVVSPFAIGAEIGSSSGVSMSIIGNIKST